MEALKALEEGHCLGIRPGDNMRYIERVKIRAMPSLAWQGGAEGINICQYAGDWFLVVVDHNELKEKLDEVRGVISNIHDEAHCIEKAGPISTPTLDIAWGKFGHLALKATQALQLLK